MPRRTVALALVALAMAVSANAQSFGRNKVHYGDFDFQVLETPHFDIYYYPAERDASIEAGRLAERWYARLSRVLDHHFTSRQPIILYASHADFRQTNVIPQLLSDGVGGVTEHEKGRVVLPFAAGLGETDHVLGHELVHAFQRDILRSRGRAMSTLPLWFLEGMAEYLSVGGIDSNTKMWLRDAAHQEHLPRIDQLSNPQWFPYRYGQALWAYLGTRFGDDVVAKILKSKAPGGAIGKLTAVTGVDVATLSAAWHQSIESLVNTEATDSPAEAAAPDSDAVIGNGPLNVGPALSPDGESLVFVSQRDGFSIDVVLADAATGAIRRRLIQTAADPHFESLQFIESAGAWDPGGGRFALAAHSRGMPVITILNTANGMTEREMPIREVDQVFNPTWSPDGTRIAFSALRNGFSDLYVLDLETSSISALTTDAFADLQPAWSPDGRTIAFATDRFSSSLQTLTFGEFRLGAVDVDTGAIRELPSVPGAKNIDPHWSADGASLYFVADAGSVSNVYRVALEDAQLFQVTDVPTGVSGLTSLSPALAVASKANRLAFSVYRQGGYAIETREAGPGTATTDRTASSENVNPAPSSEIAPAPTAVTRAPNAPSALPLFGVPDGKAFTSRPYRAGLSLNRMVQPYLSAGGGSTGGFLRAGVGLSFGDMLGNHQLQTLVQVGKTADDFVAQAAYLNLRSRWNWAIVGNQVPWLTGVGSPRTPVDLETGTLTRQTDLFRQLHRQFSGMAIYPFSDSRRLELTGGLQSIAYSRETIVNTYSATTGRLVNQTSARTIAAPTATLVESGAALVNDTAVYGLTSPILGERYRFGMAPTVGSLTFTTVLADYRRYWMPFRPFTFAMRAMTVGRYGSSSGDPRLLPLAWTLRDVVRGYGDLGPASVAGGYLSANRMLVGSFELRFPLLALVTKHAQPGQWIEGLVFSDAGKFWMPQSRLVSSPALLPSVGAGVRMNAAGLIFELDAVRRLDSRPRGWTFAFNYRPGF